MSIVGLGGNSCHVALAADHIGFALVVGIDPDVVSESNLSRQVLYKREAVGGSKAGGCRRITLPSLPCGPGAEAW